VASLVQAISHAVAKLPEGEVFSSSDFPSLGDRAAVRRVLAALAQRQELFRIERGLYVAPVTGRFGRRSPAPSKVVASLGAKRGEQVCPSGAASANLLGLSSQVPIREVYLTSGKSRRLTVGLRVVQLRHAPKVLLQPGLEGHAARVRFSLAHEPQALAMLDELMASRGAREPKLARSKRG
jgi:hypothetical protein